VTKSDQPKPAPTPLLLVYGKPTSPALPQASWFRIEERQAVIAAAQTLRFNVIEIATEADRASFAGVHEGVLKNQERMIVGSVAVEVYQRIEAYVRKAAGDRASPTMSNEVAEVGPALEQNKNPSVGSEPFTASAPQTASAGAPTSGTGTAPPANSLNPAQSLRVGARVLAACWNKKNEFDGFWLATVKRIDKNELTLEWVQAPEYPVFKSKPTDIAVPHPHFRMSRK
jgi:hypothetical protein